MARAALSAGKQGNYWGMSSLLYENHPQSETTLTPLVEKLGLDKEKFYKDMNSKETSDKLQEEVYHTYELNLDSTPTTFVNGEKKVGLMSYEDLQKWLEEHGAKRR
jgi:predicted DsbA family dithiol-disulfide isomerase